MLTYKLGLAIPPRVRMRTPTLRIGKQEIEIGMNEIVASDVQEDIASRVQEMATFDDLPLKVRPSWGGEKYPVFEAMTRGTPQAYFASRMSFHDLITEIRRAKKPLSDHDSETPA